MSTQTLYGILNQDAQSWWHYKALRKAGQVKEARQKERESIRSSVRHLRQTIKNKGHISYGRGGWSLNMGGGGSVSGYGDSGTFAAALHVGIPFIDTRTIPDSKISKTISLPMISSKPDAAPWGSMSYAPLEVVAAAYETLGATLHNIKPDYSRIDQIKGMSPKEAKVIRAFQTGDEMTLAQEMFKR